LRNIFALHPWNVLLSVAVFVLAPFESVAVGVGNHKSSESFMGRSDSSSRNTERPCGVATALQVVQGPVQSEAYETINILSNNPRGPDFQNESHKIRPEITRVSNASSRTSAGERLARPASKNNVNCSNIFTSQCFDVLENRHIRPVLPQDRPAERVYFTHCNDAPALGFEGQVESADSRKKR
jgi:hypothetical protein